MKIKRYEARTEQEAIEKVKEELGSDALVLNIKKTQPRGIFALFRKPVVEVTAAYDDKFSGKATKDVPTPVQKGNAPAAEAPEAPVTNPPIASLTEWENYFGKGGASALGGTSNDKASENSSKDKKIIEQQEVIKNLEKRLSSNEDLLSKMVERLNRARSMESMSSRKYDNNVIQAIYDTLIEQGVTPEVAFKVLEDADAIKGDESADIVLLTKVVYNNIMEILGEPKPVKVRKGEDGSADTIFFLGPTGVGKTTTIAKLSSSFILSNDYRVGLVTADTYRIAAVEQLKTYGEILGIDVCVVYKAEDLQRHLYTLAETEDVVMIDTAGRSHKNKENLEELKQILNTAPDSRKFLVLSITTRYEDLIDIVRIYSGITDFDLIFTKLDETTTLGSILNVCSLTGKRLSYLAYGQNVPDDIEIMQSEKIAKALLGFGGGVF